MAVAEVSIKPVGTGSTSIGDVVAACVRVLKSEPNVRYDVTEMGTLLEGDLHRLLALVERILDACFQAGAERVVTTIRLDERRDKAMSLQDVEHEVEQRLAVWS